MRKFVEVVPKEKRGTFPARRKEERPLRAVEDPGKKGTRHGEEETSEAVRRSRGVEKLAIHRHGLCQEGRGLFEPAEKEKEKESHGGGRRRLRGARFFSSEKWGKEKRKMNRPGPGGDRKKRERRSTTRITDESHCLRCGSLRANRGKGKGKRPLLDGGKKEKRVLETEGNKDEERSRGGGGGSIRGAAQLTNEEERLHFGKEKRRRSCSFSGEKERFFRHP